MAIVMNPAREKFLKEQRRPFPLSLLQNPRIGSRRRFSQ